MGCMLSHKPDMMFKEKIFDANLVKLYETERPKLAKICVHGLLSFEPPNLERYPFMGRDDNSLDEIEHEEKAICCVIKVLTIKQTNRMKITMIKI